MTRRWYDVCPVPGCFATGGTEWMVGHAKREHVSCPCGWVGVSLNKHLGQVRKRGYGRSHRRPDPVAALRELAAEVAAFPTDAEPPVDEWAARVAAINMTFHLDRARNCSEVEPFVDWATLSR